MMGDTTHWTSSVRRLAAAGLLSAAAFGLAGCGTAGTDSGEDAEDATVSPLLVISGQQVAELQEGQLVQVTGTVQESFDLSQVEEQTEQDLDDERFTDRDGQPYIEATTVSTDIPAR